MYSSLTGSAEEKQLETALPVSPRVYQQPIDSSDIKERASPFHDWGLTELVFGGPAQVTTGAVS